MRLSDDTHDTAATRRTELSEALDSKARGARAPRKILRDDVRRLVEGGAQLVEVLPRAHYDKHHLAGAISIPLGELNRGSAARLQRDRAVVVYCYDALCDLGSRAAWQLAHLGFEQVYHYVPGKADWFAAGLPGEGSEADLPRVGSLARPDVPTCLPNERIADVRRRVHDAGWDVCVVTDEARIVLGLLRQEQLASGGDIVAEEIMDLAPGTSRIDMTIEAMAEHMRTKGVHRAWITTPDGALVGMLHRGDVEQYLASADRVKQEEHQVSLGLGDRARSKLNRRAGTVDAVDEDDRGRKYGLRYDEQPQDKHNPLPGHDGAQLPPELIEPE